MKTETFIRRRLIAAPAEVVFRWHAEPGALHLQEKLLFELIDDKRRLTLSF